jgi:hypothetical protein
MTNSSERRKGWLISAQAATRTAMIKICKIERKAAGFVYQKQCVASKLNQPGARLAIIRG